METQRVDVKAESSTVVKEELAKLEAHWQKKYQDIEVAHADIVSSQDHTIAKPQQELNKAWATIDEADDTWFGESATGPDDPTPPDGGAELASPEFGQKEDREQRGRCVPLERERERETGGKEREN
jgi:hypothetical protein